MREVNGCGACSGFWKWFKPPHSNFFIEECNQHDIAYNIGGDEKDRKGADLSLFKGMTNSVTLYFHKRKPFSKIWFLTLCWCYYIGVRLFGYSSFNYNKINNMKTKTFLGLPLITSVKLEGLFRNWLSIILFTGIGYFLFAILLGSFAGDTWKYVQSSEKQYIVQAFLLLAGVVFGHFARVFLNKAGDRFFILKKVDYIFYFVGFILTYFVINEIWGL